VYAYFSLTFAKIVRAFTKMGPIFAKVKVKIELKIVPLSGPPRSTFAKVDFDFGKSEILQFKLYLIFYHDYCMML